MRKEVNDEIPKHIFLTTSKQRLLKLIPFQ
ncbi:hypothetical protein GNT15_10865 [Vibrio parahaemolyticus]|nr:hypothetical protein DA442_24520 [Vibrio parahaemolyticus]EGQ8406811.1 hypothetical protein [Vibrio parahaemolyticus]EGQ8606552.1 hypothetical protein [Vibrio parahaemolyticus]EGQ8700781.1 hypothetical protein [Vibrio parahaemolyticus]EGQ8737079.1 hypothetical protein [Vibrio parahaemolyticus]